MNPQADKITLRLEARKVSASDFKAAVNNFLDMIKDVADDVAGRRKRVAWVVSVEVGSTCLIAEPVPSTTADASVIPPALSAIRDGMVAVSSGRPYIPKHWSDKAVQHMKELASLSGDSKPGESISVRFGEDTPVMLTKATADTVSKMFAAQVHSLGSIEGRLEMLSLRSGFKCHIYDALTDHRVNCTYDTDLFESVKAALGERVSAYGIISYAADGRPVALKLQSIRILDRVENLPDWDDVRGILRG